MHDLFWFSEMQLARIEPFFLLSHGVARVDDRRMVFGVIFVIRNGLCWCDTAIDFLTKLIFTPESSKT